MIGKDHSVHVCHIQSTETNSQSVDENFQNVQEFEGYLEFQSSLFQSYINELYHTSQIVKFVTDMKDDFRIIGISTTHSTLISDRQIKIPEFSKISSENKDAELNPSKKCKRDLSKVVEDCEKYSLNENYIEASYVTRYILVFAKSCTLCERVQVMFKQNSPLFLHYKFEIGSITYILMNINSDKFSNNS